MDLFTRCIREQNEMHNNGKENTEQNQNQRKTIETNTVRHDEQTMCIVCDVTMFISFLTHAINLVLALTVDRNCHMFFFAWV